MTTITVTGTLQAIDGTAASGVQVTAAPSAGYFLNVSGSWVEVASGTLTATTDSTGAWSLSLPATDVTDPAIAWTITVPLVGSLTGTVTAALGSPVTLYALWSTHGWTVP